MPAFGTGPLLLGTAGLLLICLLRTPLRWSGAVLALVAGLWALDAPRPDVLVAGDGRAAAMRGADGRLTFLSRGRDSFVVKDWLAADGDGRGAKDKSLHDGVTCDAIGCVGRFKDGRLAALALKVEAFVEDCPRAAVVISMREAQRACAATLIDRKVWRAHGATALRWTGDHFAERFARPPNTDRPWAQRAAEISQPSVQTAPRNATPKQEDLETGD